MVIYFSNPILIFVFLNNFVMAGVSEVSPFFSLSYFFSFCLVAYPCYYFFFVPVLSAVVMMV